MTVCRFYLCEIFASCLKASSTFQDLTLTVAMCRKRLLYSFCHHFLLKYLLIYSLHVVCDSYNLQRLTQYVRTPVQWQFCFRFMIRSELQ